MYQVDIPGNFRIILDGRLDFVRNMAAADIDRAHGLRDRLDRMAALHVILGSDPGYALGDQLHAILFQGEINALFSGGRELIQHLKAESCLSQGADRADHVQTGIQSCAFLVQVRKSGLPVLVAHEL